MRTTLRRLDLEPGFDRVACVAAGLRMLVAIGMLVVVWPLQVLQELLVGAVRPFALFGEMGIGHGPRVYRAGEILMVRMRLAGVGEREARHGRQRGGDRAQSFQHYQTLWNFYSINGAACRIRTSPKWG